MQRRVGRLAVAGALATVTGLALTPAAPAPVSPKAPPHPPTALSPRATTRCPCSSRRAGTPRRQPAGRRGRLGRRVWDRCRGPGRERPSPAAQPGFRLGLPSRRLYLSTDALAGSPRTQPPRLRRPAEQRRRLLPDPRRHFTYDGSFYCAPKDFSTLGLVINTQMWQEAGLTDARHPHNLGRSPGRRGQADDPEHVGLTFSPEYARVGALHGTGRGLPHERRRHRGDSRLPETSPG